MNKTPGLSNWCLFFWTEYIYGILALTDSFQNIYKMAPEHHRHQKVSVIINGTLCFYTMAVDLVKLYFFNRKRQEYSSTFT